MEKKKVHKKAVAHKKTTATASAVPTAKAEKQPKKIKPSQTTIMIIIAAVIIIIAAIVLLAVLGPKGRAWATINGEKITKEQFYDVWDGIPESYKGSITKQQVLDELVNQKILLQRAKEIGIPKDPVATEARVEQIIEQAAEQQGMTYEQLMSTLEAEGKSREKTKTSVYESVIIDDLIKEELVSKAEVTAEEVQQFYEDNLQTFTLPQNVTVSHILINIDEETTDQQALDLITDIKDMVTPDFSNFCDLVTEYSEDIGSVEVCGKYAFDETAPLVQEFKDASFNQEVDEMSIVKSVFGYHLIWTRGKTPWRILSFEEVEELIEQNLKAQKANQAYPDYLAGLKAKANIVPENPLIPESERDPPAQR